MPAQTRILDELAGFGTVENLLQAQQAPTGLIDLVARVRVELGEAAYIDLLQLGPDRKGVRSTPLPLKVKLEEILFNGVVATADIECNCATQFGNGDCGGDVPICSELISCSWTWGFGCGPWYLFSCTGYCQPMIEGR